MGYILMGGTYIAYKNRRNIKGGDFNDSVNLNQGDSQDSLHDLSFELQAVFWIKLRCFFWRMMPKMMKHRLICGL